MSPRAGKRGKRPKDTAGAGQGGGTAEGAKWGGGKGRFFTPPTCAALAMGTARTFSY